MSIKTEHNKHVGHEDWPTVLTPDLRAKLIQAKIARVQAMLDSRDRQQEHTSTCYEPNCACH